MLNVAVLPTLSDNYTYVLWQGQRACVIDPGAPEPAADFLEKHALKLDYVLNTHGHADHTGGNQALQARFGGILMGGGASPLPGTNRPVKDGDELPFGRTPIRILTTPGHTRDSICYYAPSRPGKLFTGDTLFIGGCGRLFDGTSRDLWLSLKKLGALPDNTEIYPGHEYTLENYAFCLEQEPADAVLKKQAELAREKIARGLPTPPSTLGAEKATNPFLRAASPEELAHWRERKNTF
jgi:hydroxyacylglutathione hydrolase